MATANKVAKLCPEGSDSESDDSSAWQEERSVTPFPPTDVILEVQGMDIHLNKQVLMDASPVFKRMFESDFSEKHKDRIPLPEKKYAEFVNFLYTFYNPELLAPITEKNVLEVACLADEYEIMDLKLKCELFILDNFERACEEGGFHIDTDTLVNYAVYAEKHGVELLLPSTIILCSKRSIESLKQANFETRLTTDTQQKSWIFDVLLWNEKLHLL
ncbi:uncharacterized protein LOC134258468 [Saccostrea cucullata]|uniref:uncharacterized protein LOC134258468 n=1 Tax=Saccostrea cuccullata TaxID=36930 RepID=UPI002ED231FF